MLILSVSLPQEARQRHEDFTDPNILQNNGTIAHREEFTTYVDPCQRISGMRITNNIPGPLPHGMRFSLPKLAAQLLTFPDPKPNQTEGLVSNWPSSQPDMEKLKALAEDSFSDNAAFAKNKSIVIHLFYTLHHSFTKPRVTPDCLSLPPVPLPGPFSKLSAGATTVILFMALQRCKNRADYDG